MMTMYVNLHNKPVEPLERAPSSYFHGLKASPGGVSTWQPRQCCYIPELKYGGTLVVDLRAFRRCVNFGGQRGANQTKSMRRTRPISCRSDWVSVTAAAAQSVRNALCDARARMALQQRTQLLKCKSEAIDGWPCISAQTL